MRLTEFVLGRVFGQYIFAAWGKYKSAKVFIFASDI